MHIQKSICLHSTADGADKVYNIQIVETGEGYVVQYQNGRRGGTLASGTKTRTPVSLDSAAKIFNSLVNEKVNGRSHYKVIGTDGNTAVTPVAERALSGVLPMVPTAVDESQVASLLSDSSWAMQPKMDGERVMVTGRAGSIVASNRLGFVRPLPDVLADEIRSSPFAQDSRVNQNCAAGPALQGGEG